MIHDNPPIHTLPFPLNVYIACSSREIERANKAAMAVKRAGMTCISTWMKTIYDVGSANPRGADRLELQRWSWSCVNQVGSSDVLWLMIGEPTIGAWIEAGFAMARKIPVLMSGDWRRTVFSGQCYRVDNDDDALQWLTMMNRS